MKRQLFRWFDLRQDQAPSDQIDTALRANARAAGTNLWVLFFAMLIASVGLNVNSTAVIIGAMLISPLMGPIVGLGYGAAVADLRLMRSSALSVLVFTGLSLATSTLYFTLSPLTEPGSELLSRTSPTLWDVLIAAFGGAAGMVAITRQGFNNIVLGVAISTALMPPLCTVGFGLAHQRWEMAGGAAYLFAINSIFIAAASLVVARVLRLPPVATLQDGVRRMHRWAIGLGLLATLLPSVWLGHRLVQNEVFAAKAGRLVQQLQGQSGLVLASAIDAPRRQIAVSVVGPLEEQQLRLLAGPLLVQAGLQADALRWRRAGDAQWALWRQRGDAREQQIAALTERVQQLQSRLDAVAQTAEHAASEAAQAASRAESAADAASAALQRTASHSSKTAHRRS